MKRDHTKLILIISILIALVFTFVLFSFFKVIKNKNEYISKVLTTLSNKITSKNNAELLIKKSSELDNIYKTINSYFIDSTKINIFVDNLENLGSENNTTLTVKNVAISNTQKKTILVGVSVVGNFNNVIKVIYLLENSSFYVNVTQAFVNKKINPIDLKVKDKKISNTPPIWQADISFSVLTL